MPEENLDGIPDVKGLDQVVKDLETEGKTKEKEVVTEDGELDLAQFGNDPQKLLKGYKHIQAGFTRLSQENKALKEQLAAKPVKDDAPMPPITNDDVSNQKAFDETLIEDPEKAMRTTRMSFRNAFHMFKCFRRIRNSASMPVMQRA
jgi:hypothetical protein